MSSSKLLAGPIIKKLTGSEVRIWIASSIAPQDNSLILLKSGKPISCSVSHETLRLSTELFASLFTIIFDGVSEGAFTYKFSLDEIECLEGLNLSLNKNEALPGFVIKPDLHTFAHASCRKPHGLGEDAFVALKKNLDKKPIDALFLTGDQIYADDVDRTMFDYIKNIGNDLQLLAEPLAGLQGIPVAGRSKLLKEKANFTSEASDCHLMTIAEYVVMHLLAFSPILWPSNKAPHLQEYYDGSVALSNIMANVPTYFMLDDHDVTDDWNLNEAWRNKVEEALLGKQIIANASTAFFICQIWGNHERFDKYIPLIRDRLDQPLSTAFQQKLSELDWTYETQTSPQALVMDTRSCRYGFKKLMQIRRPEKLTSALSRVSKTENEQLILVSPAPVFGIPVLEKVQDFVAGLMGATKVDHERWFKSAFTNLLRNLSGSKFDNIIILSGDFHYAMNIQVKVMRDKRPPLHIYQMVSSAAKNSSSVSWFLNVVSIIRNLFRPSTKGDGDVQFDWSLRFLNNLLCPTVLNSNNVGIVEIQDSGPSTDTKTFFVTHQLLTNSKYNSKNVNKVTFKPSFWHFCKFYRGLTLVVSLPCFIFLLGYILLCGLESILHMFMSVIGFF